MGICTSVSKNPTDAKMMANKDVPFDFNAKLFKHRQHKVTPRDSLLYGGDQPANRLAGCFSNDQELDHLHKELCLSPRGPKGKYNFQPRRDILLHGSNGPESKLNGYFSSNEKLDDLDVTRKATIAQGRIKANRADFSDDSVLHSAHRPDGPYNKVARLAREESGQYVAENGTSLYFPSVEAKPEANHTCGFVHELLTGYDHRELGEDVMKAAIGISDRSRFEYRNTMINSSGPNNASPAVSPVRRRCSIEHRQELDYQEMKNDSSYPWATNSSVSPTKPAKLTGPPTEEEMLLFPLGFAGSVPSAVLEARVEKMAQAKQAGSPMKTTDLRPYDNRNLQTDVNGCQKEPLNQPGFYAKRQEIESQLAAFNEANTAAASTAMTENEGSYAAAKEKCYAINFVATRPAQAKPPARGPMSPRAPFATS